MEEVTLEWFVDPLGQLAFLERMYLGSDGFIAAGGSKVKFVTGRIGSGKTTMLQALLARAGELDYLVSEIDARSVAIRSIDDLYRALLAPVDLREVMDRFCRQVITALGSEADAIPDGLTYAEWMVRRGRAIEIVRREVREDLERRVFQDAHLHRSFAFAVMQLAAHHLGVTPRPADEYVTLEQWLKGARVMARERNRLGLRLAIDRYSARLMLRSWLHFVRLAGYRGHVAVVDNFDVVLNTDPGSDLPRYTRMRRNDLYEAIRELIDDVDNLEGFFFVVAGAKELFQDPKAGLQSYPALWMRIQNEVEPDPHSHQVNRFADVLDLDRLWDAAGREALVSVAIRKAGLPDHVYSPDERRVQELETLVNGVLESRDRTISPVQRVVQGVLERRRRWLA